MGAGASRGGDADAIVVGSGPNGLAAAVTLARAGLRVVVVERSDHVGGGAATRELLVPGVWHDVCSAVHPLALAGEFFRRFHITERVRFLTPEVSYAQAVTPAHAALAWRSLDRTADALGEDGDAWRRLLGPLAAEPARLWNLAGRPAWRVPDDPAFLLRFAARVARHGIRGRAGGFRGDDAPALLAGVFAHTTGPLPGLGAAAAGLVLTGLAHAGGWPIPYGGSASIVRALTADLAAHGGLIETGVEVTDLG
ncbi:MAG TPA: NAD(P)/FAD-dependent oxidoreductase, partial [Microbacteriaceae bacterium]|nr:NAD(P)/FAD-dependent oxidoreductase [Microbacteriaceae bacterium]